MKLRRFLSFIVTLAVVTANTAVTGLFAAYAATTDTDTVYSEDFEGKSGNFQNTLLGLKDYGWYMADNNTLYTTVDTVAPYSTYNYKLARLTAKDGSQCLQIVSAGANTGGSDTDNTNEDTPKFGYAKTFPGVTPGEGAKGVWEVSFDFKPALVSNKTQFAFTFNTTDGSEANETAAVHNIIAGYGQRFYFGYRDYNALLNKSITQGTWKATKKEDIKWYRIRTVLNCDAHYYSVEFYDRDAGTLIARRSPISFDKDETIGCIKFSALGLGNVSYYVYLDNISMRKVSSESYIYNETFDTFTSNSYVSSEGITTGAETEDFAGTSYFEGYTPWRFHKDIGNSYSLENDTALSSKVVRLGDKPGTAGSTEASGLVYMQANDTLLTQGAEPLRGMLKTSFKIKPETVVDDFTVNAISDVGDDITNDSFAWFRIKNVNGTPQFVKANGDCVALNASSWYDVDLVFDVLGRTVTTAVKDASGNAVADSTMTGTGTPYAVKGIMFKAAGGTSVLVDDISLKYTMPAPTVDQSGIALTDRFGETVTDLNNVTTALKTIEIPMGCPIDPETANSSSILLKDSGENAVAYEGTVSGNSYIMNLSGALSLNEEYTVTVPQTVANTFADRLGSNVTFTFRTVNSTVDISAVSVDGAPFKSISQISRGSAVNVTYSYNNVTAAAVTGRVVLAFYDDSGKLACVESCGITVPQGAHGADSTTAAFTVPNDIDMKTVDSMSVFVWDGFNSLKPLADSVNVKRKSGEAGRYREYVDFEVNIESGRDAVILQLTDPQIIDGTQVREGVAFSQQKRDFWQPSLMNKRLFNDMRALIEEVNPDLILMTGDLVYGGYDDAGTSFTRLADFMDSFGIPWAPVFGNHDNESAMGVDWQCAYLESCENCLFKQRTLTGNGNYSIGIVGDGELKRVIFMLDSNGCAVMSDESFANGHSKKSVGFGNDQIAWYTNAANKINSDFSGIKYTFAFHIQPAVFKDAFAAYGFDNDAETVGDGTGKGDFVEPINIDELEDKGASDFGYIGRKLKTPWDDDKTVYNGMKAIGADSILVGHEHCNSASVVYDGVRFQYGQKIGEYDRINFRTSEGKIVGHIAIDTSVGTPILGGTVMKLSESTGEIYDAYIRYCDK